MSENTIEFMPLHGINEFMRPDFRLSVIRKTLGALSQLPDNLSGPINHLTRKFVKVPGFRNSEKAPTMVKVLPMANAFEKSPELVGAILSAWAEVQNELRNQVYNVLKERNWPFFPAEIHNLQELPSLKTERDWGVLPLEADRTKLPGFLVYWPKGEDFESLYDTFAKLYPEANSSLDEVSLMSVWLSMRLPYHITEDESQKDQAEGPSAPEETPPTD